MQEEYLVEEKTDEIRAEEYAIKSFFTAIL